MGKAARTEATLLGGLLEEIVLWEILVRLPPKSLLRCRAVCRSWRRELASPAFLLNHHRHQPSLPLVLGFPRGRGVYQDILALDCRAADPVARLQPVARINTSMSFVDASCDGLLILSRLHHLGQVSRVCNPVTREDAPLDVLRGFRILGFYPHHRTGEHRLLLYSDETLVHEGPIPGPRDAYYVFALGHDLPRCIGSSAVPQCLSAPVLSHGCLHWMSGGNGSMITVFDTMAESFQRMRAPSVPNREVQSDVCSYLFDIDDTLGMYSCNEGKLKSVDIWVLKDYERQVWEFKHRIGLPMAEIKQKCDGCDEWSAMVVSDEGAVLVLVFCDWWVIHINTEGKLLDISRRDGQAILVCQHKLKQSLVQHTFFPKLEGYAPNASLFI